MIFKRLTSIALIAALCLPNTLMAGRVNHYLKENDSEGRPLITTTSSSTATSPTPTKTEGNAITPPPGANTFVTVPLESSSSTSTAPTPNILESQVGPSRKRSTCTTERLNCIASCVGYSLGSLLIIGVIAEIITFILFSSFAADPCANQTTASVTLMADQTFAPATVGPSGRGRTINAPHQYQKRRGGGGPRGGASRICPPPSTHSYTTSTSTLLSNFYDLTSSGSTSKDTSSTTSDTTPPPLTQE